MRHDIDRNIINVNEFMTIVVNLQSLEDLHLPVQVMTNIFIVSRYFFNIGKATGMV